MAHSHSHRHGGNGSRRFALGAGLNLAFVAVEAAGGLAAGSLALLSDAGHNLSDVLGLLLAWGAAALARGRTTDRRTYGLRRTSILAALLNAVLLLVAVGGIVWEAIHRLASPSPLNARLVVAVAAAGVLVNAASAALFWQGRHRDLNLRGAFLHLAADAAVSLGVLLAALGIQQTGWLWLDPAVSLVVAVVITAGTWGLLRDAVNLALDAVPAGIDLAAVRAHLAGLPAVTGVHDLHVWAMSTSEVAMTAHLVAPPGQDHDTLLAAAAQELHARFGIDHSTIQIETAGCAEPPCEPA